MKSRTLKRLYPDWTGTAEQVELVDAVYSMAEQAGRKGEIITECFSPENILQTFRTTEDACSFIGVKSRKRREIRNA